MRLLVCGPRDMGDYSEFTYAMAWAGFCDRRPTVVMSGGASGADLFVQTWAGSLGIPHLSFPADWERHGRAAGPIRNKQMLDEGRPDLVLAFQPLGRSTPGTLNMMKQARAADVPVLVYVL